MVKRLRHRPFTAVTRVRIPVGSPTLIYSVGNSLGVSVRTNFGRIAQLGEHLPYKQGVIGSSPIAPTIYICHPERKRRILARPGSSDGTLPAGFHKMDHFGKHSVGHEDPKSISLSMQLYSIIIYLWPGSSDG
jgi:hypothetical protein